MKNISSSRPALTARVREWNMSRTFFTTMLASGGILLIAVHGLLIAGFAARLSGKNSSWLPWIAGGTLMTLGIYYLLQQVRGKGHGHSHLFGGHAPERGDIGCGPNNGLLLNLGHGFVEITIFESDLPPHLQEFFPPRFRLFFYDKHRRVRSMPTKTTITIETVRPDDARQTFTFCAKEEYLESTNTVPGPYQFRAIVRVSHGSHTHTHEVQFPG